MTDTSPPGKAAISFHASAEYCVRLSHKAIIESSVEETTVHCFSNAFMLPQSELEWLCRFLHCRPSLSSRSSFVHCDIYISFQTACTALEQTSHAGRLRLDGTERSDEKLHAGGPSVNKRHQKLIAERNDLSRRLDSVACSRAVSFQSFSAKNVMIIGCVHLGGDN